MAEIKKTRTRMYDPWGYQEENNYDSSENQFEVELNELFAYAAYNDNDKKIHFFNNDGKELSGSSIDTTEFASGSVIKHAYYDPATKKIVIEFENGDVVEIDVHDLIDEYDFGGGLQVDSDGHVSILIDSTGEPYLSVSDGGIKISGINQAIATAVEAEKTRAEQAESNLQSAIDTELQRAQDAETELGNVIDILNQKLGYKDNETLQKNGEHEVAFGSYNISNSGDTPADRTIFSIGNGTADDARSNAFEVRENGDVYMWIENDYMQINRLLAMLAHEVYDNDDNSNNG